MSEVTNADLMGVLLGVKGDIGGIQAKLAAHATAFEAHVRDDQRIADNVKALEIASAKAVGVAKGRTTAWGMIAAVASTLAALIVDYLRH